MRCLVRSGIRVLGYGLIPGQGDLMSWDLWHLPLTSLPVGYSPSLSETGLGHSPSAGACFQAQESSKPVP